MDTAPGASAAALPTTTDAASGPDSAAATSPATTATKAAASTRAKPKAAAPARTTGAAKNLPAAVDPGVRLHRKQDNWISGYMTKAEADATLAGYPGEYEVYKTPKGENPPVKAAAKP